MDAVDTKVHGNCASCCREVIIPTAWYAQSFGRIWHFCSQRCHDRFVTDATRCLIVSPRYEV